MSLHIDTAYINRISGYLNLFKWKRGNLAFCRCPVCGDSAKKKFLRRFFFYQDVKHGADYMSVKCQNCDYSNPFGAFLKEYYPSIYDDYQFEIFKEKGWSTRRWDQESTPSPRKAPPVDFFASCGTSVVDKIEGLVGVLELPESHMCIQYLNSRKIPKTVWHRLAYADEFGTAMSHFADDPTTAEKIPKDARLVIPFKTETGMVSCIQGRALTAKAMMRYITIKKNDAQEKLFGLEQINQTNPVYVVEGPIDSLFIENSIATADANLSAARIGDIMVHDNQPRSREICRYMEASISAGKSVVIWPKGFEWKDINDAISKGGYSISDLMEIIESNTYKGLMAKAVFSRWKMV